MYRPLLTTACLLATAFPLTAEQTPPPWRSLMDGKTLAGWHAVGDGKWTVEDGAFVGRADNEKLYGLLVSDRTFRDFDVRFKFKCPAGDSGFYVRTLIKEPEKAHGLQVQVGPAGTGAGGIYESYGRAWLVKPDPKKESTYLHPDDWNEMLVSAHGGEVTVTLNGTQTAKLTNDPSRPEGRLALQMHAGCKMEVRFKDLEIREYPQGDGGQAK